MTIPSAPSHSDQTRALWLSTLAFTLCFAVWTIFSIIGVQIKRDLGLTETQFGLLVGTPILTGSLIRLILGIWPTSMAAASSMPDHAGSLCRDAAAHLCLRLPDLPPGGARRRHCRRLLRRRRDLCLQVVPEGEAGDGPRHLRRRQCRRGGDQVRRSLHHARLRLAHGRHRLGGGARRHDGGLLVRHQGRSRPCPPPLARSAARTDLGPAGAAEERSGLALRPLLLLSSSAPSSRSPSGCRATSSASMASTLRRPAWSAPPIRFPPRSSAPMAATSPTSSARGPSCTGRSSSRSSAPSCCPTRRRNTWCAPPLAPSPSTWRSASSPSW